MRDSARPHRRWLVPLGAVLVACVAGAAFGAGVWYGERKADARDEWAEARLLSSAIDSVRTNALDSLPNDELIRRAVSGMLRELHDPYAALLRPDGFERYRGSLQGMGRGFGLTLRRDARGAGVARVAAGSPALAAGIRAGDRILAVDGVPVREGWGAPRDSSAPPPSQHLLTLWRAPHGDTVRVVVKRLPWHLPAVSDQGLLTDRVGYVRLATFSVRSSDEVEQTVEGLVQRGARSLVLDLRGNAGGLFEEGVKVAGLFLERGQLVASLSGRSGAELQPHYARHSRWPDLPITVLVDAGTASAAEIVAAALHDHQRAVLVGTPTYGKGVVQRVVTISKDIALRLTTARWLTPKGVALERRVTKGNAVRGGITPDVLLDDADRRDPYGVPSEWTRGHVRVVSERADSVAMFALRAGWSTATLSLLEARLRAALAQMVPQSMQTPVDQAEWVTVATRLATVRMLEVELEREALLRYTVREDAALRAAIDVVEPGAELPQLVPSPLSPAVSRRSFPLP
jgi:carboxyl-terminal processing protease